MEDRRTNGAGEAIVDAVAVEDPPPVSTELAGRARRSEVLHPLDREQLVASFREYQELCRALLDDSDYQSYTQRERDASGEWRTVEKRFKKKSAWRKLATAFDLDVQIVHCEVERDGHGHALRASVIARAIAPSGRYQDGDGYCSASEPRFTRDKGREKLENDLRGTACVPLGAQILTRRGWRGCDEIEVGEEILAYDVGGDACRWTPLRDVSVYENSTVVRVGNAQTWSMVCTPDHSWAVSMDKPRVRAADRRPCETQSLPRTGRIIHAARVEDGGRWVDPRDAAILGWLITVGRVTWDAFYPRATVHQSKEPYVEELRELLGADAREEYADRPPRTFPSGRTYTIKRAFRWTLTSKFLAAWMRRTGVYSAADVIPFATRITGPARAAMLDAMLKADGCKRSERAWTRSKAKRPVIDVFEILAALEGFALGREWRKDTTQTALTLRANRMTDIQHVRIEPGVPQAVWCPTTDYGSWVMRLDGLVSITGNTTRAKNRAISDLLGTGEVSA